MTVYRDDFITNIHGSAQDRRWPVETVAKSQHGEGSRGGHIIGHTKSGKPIYSNGTHTFANHLRPITHLSVHHDGPDFSAKDHFDAADMHHKMAASYARRAHEMSNPEPGDNPYENRAEHDFATTMASLHGDDARDHLAAGLGLGDKRYFNGDHDAAAKKHLAIAGKIRAKLRSIDHTGPQSKSEGMADQLHLHEGLAQMHRIKSAHEKGLPLPGMSEEG